MATPPRIVTLARTFIRTHVFIFSRSWRYLQRSSTNKSYVRKNQKVTFGLFGIPATLFSIMAASEDNKALIDESEVLYDKKDFHTMYDLLLPHKDCNDANVIWRLARASTEKGKAMDADGRKKHIYEAFEYAKRALELDDKNFACHKWYAILLDYTAEYEGNKKRLQNSFIVKEHFMKAIELNPSDATTMYCLGYWCFLFADMPWYQRKIASALFAAPPTSTYEEALQYFEAAEKAEPGFYCQNLVMWATALIKLKKDKGKAKEILQKAAEYDQKTTDDEKAVEQAKKMLKSEF